jgi:biotin transport system substrate-specific component
MATTRRPVREMTTAALLASLMAASSLIAIPIGGPVPITLQVFVVVLTALLLRPAWAGAAMAVYLLLGAVGVPVFAGGTGGLGALLGPTGGYLWGFLFGAILGSGVRVSFADRIGPAVVSDALGALTTIVVIYALGFTQLLVVTNIGVQGLTPTQAFVAGVVPFIGVDALKAVVAVIVAEALRRTGVVPGTPRPTAKVAEATGSAS